LPDRQPGKQFFSRTHRLTVDRTTFIIEPLAEESRPEIVVPETIAAMQYPLNLKFEEINPDTAFSIPTESHIACLDRDILKFPLKIRRWKKGDYFIPLGMKGRKKLSDYFVDKKISVPDKRNTWVLESDGNIAWVIGRRIDDRYKVTNNTKGILQITFVSISGDEY
jgi:tRNA(Ile)-lysidine synthase